MNPIIGNSPVQNRDHRPSNLMHPAQARPALLQLLGENRDDSATRRAFEVLGRIGDEADVGALAARLRAASGTLAGDAAHGLAPHRHTAAREALESAAKSDILNAAAAAVTGLEERRPETRAVLEELLDHVHPSIRYRAVRALRALGARPSRAALQRRREVGSDRDVRALIDEALE